MRGGDAAAAAALASSTQVLLPGIVCTFGLEVLAHWQAAATASGPALNKVVPASHAEALLRRLLPQLPALRFQHLMRVVRHELFCVLDPAEEGRCACPPLLA